MTDEGPVTMLVVVNEQTRECLAIDLTQTLVNVDVLEYIAWLMATRGVPGHTRSNNGQAFAARAVHAWLATVGVKALFIEPGSPWKNG